MFVGVQEKINFNFTIEILARYFYNESKIWIFFHSIDDHLLLCSYISQIYFCFGDPFDILWFVFYMSHIKIYISIQSFVMFII